MGFNSGFKGSIKETECILRLTQLYGWHNCMADTPVCLSCCYAIISCYFDIHVTVHRDKFLTIKPTSYTNFSNLFWNETLHVSDSSSVHHQEFSTVHTAMVYVTQPLCIERHTANLYDLYHCRVYSGKLLMMDRGTVRNM